MRKIAIALIVGLVLASMPSALAADYVGVGIQCRTYGETIAKVKDITLGDVMREIMDGDAEIEGDIKCITYNVYNPFDVKLSSSLEFSGEVKDLLISLEPESVVVDPEIHKMPHEGIPIRACFRIKTKYPYTPYRYTGSTMAVWSMSQGLGGGAGSATGGSVECPLYLQVNTNAGQEVMLRQRGEALFKLQVVIVVVIAVIVLLVVLAMYKRKKRKEWETKLRNVCVTCKKQYPLNLKHCPKCGGKLRKFKAGKEV